MSSNGERSERVYPFIKSYNSEHGDGDMTNPAETITDMITDLLHAAKLSGNNPQGTLNLALKHFEAETKEGT